MSNREYPNSGYLIEAEKLAKFFEDAGDREEYLAILKLCEFDEALDLLEGVLPSDVPMPAQIFSLGDTDTPDEDMKQDVPYAYFEEEDLYKLVEQPAMVALRAKIGAKPTRHCWSIWS